MLSLTSYTLKPFSSFHPSVLLLSKPSLKPISATFSNPSPPPSQQQLYQPLRPPPSHPNQFRSLDVNSCPKVVANRLGLWFEYAPLIPSLIQEGFTPPSLEEATGISGVKQNHLIAVAQVRDSLVQHNTDPAVVSAFDLDGAELLYEIRFPNAQQRSSAALLHRHQWPRRPRSPGSRPLRSAGDFPSRKGDKGRENFDYTQPGDCLAFMYFRRSREHKNPSEKRTAALERALSAAVTERAKGRVLEELNAGGDPEITGEVEIREEVRVPVVRLKIGEVAEASTVAVLPVCKAEDREKGLEEAPRECWTEGEFGVVATEKGWARWVVLPGWKPMAGLGKGGVVISFSDARVLPWTSNRWYKEEAILVVADRERKDVSQDNGFYLVGGNGSDLKVERGSTLKEFGVEESLGTVVLVIRPPKDEMDDQLSDEDWE